MFKLRVVAKDKEFVQTFQEEKLALLYRDYHVRFGQWSSHFCWIREDLATKEDKALVVDERNEFEDGIVYKMLFCGRDITVSIEEINAKSQKNRWVELRVKRNAYLK